MLLDFIRSVDIYLFQCLPYMSSIHVFQSLYVFHTCSSLEAYCEMCRQCKGGTCLWLWFTTKTMNTQSVPSYCIISCLSPGASFMLCSCCCLFSRYPAFQNMLDFCLQEPNSFTKDVDAISCVPGARSF